MAADYQLRDSHRQFIQIMMSNGCLEKKDIKRAFAELCARYNDLQIGNEEDMQRFFQVINLKLRGFQLEVKKCIDEYSGKAFYVLVNKIDNDTTRQSSDFNAIELELFQKLIETVVESDTGVVSSVMALNLASQLSKKMAVSHAEEVLVKLLQAGWLGKTVDGQYYLAVRTLAEMEGFIRQLCGDSAQCLLCQQLCVQGQKCPSCDSAVHHHCASKFKSGKRDVRCPNRQCNEPWPVADNDKGGGRRSADGEENSCDEATGSMTQQQPVHRKRKR